jgi:pimeloyl-ACP methyl ester carboxylesterase
MFGVITSRMRGVPLAIAAMAAFVMLAGVTFQSVATALERRQFLHPGRLVDVGGHQLHIYCVGDGSPTVVLESPAAVPSVAWGWVQSELSQTTRVCSYDRSGLGWSEAGDRGYEPARVPDELHALLESAGERSPFVMVGHELGATFARGFATRFRHETAALVLVDELSATSDFSHRGITRLVGAWPWLARIGVLRATRSLSKRASGLPEPASGAARAFLNRPDHLTRSALEISRMREAAAVATTPIDPRIRIARVTVDGQQPPNLLASSDRAHTVARAIKEVVSQVRR